MMNHLKFWETFMLKVQEGKKRCSVQRRFSSRGNKDRCCSWKKNAKIIFWLHLRACTMRWRSLTNMGCFQIINTILIFTYPTYGIYICPILTHIICNSLNSVIKLLKSFKSNKTGFIPFILWRRSPSSFGRVYYTETPRILKYCSNDFT